MADGQSNSCCATCTVFLVLFACLLPLRDVLSLEGRKGSFLSLTTAARVNSDDVFGAAFPCEHFYRRHLGFSQPRGKRFLSLKIAYYSNSIAAFQVIRLLSSGDICPIPGPTLRGNVAACSVCRRTVAHNHRTINCDLVIFGVTLSVAKVTPTEYKRFSTTSFSLSCPDCMMTLQSLPFADVSCLDSSTNSNDSVTSDGDIDAHHGCDIC